MIDALIWPAVVLALGLFALLLFRPTIEKKIAGITRAGKDGVSFERQQEGGEQQPPLLPFVEIMNQPISSSALEREQTINNQLQNFGLKTESEKISVLTRVLATTRVEMEFNNIAHTIFGSQLSLLAKLVGTRSGIDMTDANEIFQQAQKSHPEFHNERKIGDWLNYLQVSNLITIIENRIDITQFGKDFLKHLVDSHSAYYRYG